MVAAALRPDLFSHLFATQREAPAKGDVAATVLSVAFHGAVLLALVWASTNLRTEAPPIAEQPIPIVIATPSTDAPPTTSGGGGGGGTPTPMPRYSPILPDLDAINPTSPSDPWYEPAPQSEARPPGRTPEAGSAGGGEAMKGGFVVSSVVPALLNADEVKRELVRKYPAMLRDAGIGGDVMMWILIDEDGHVIETEVRSSSGHAALDQAARNVSGVMRFSPARNRDQMVKVWVSVPIRFRTR